MSVEEASPRALLEQVRANGNGRSAPRTVPIDSSEFDAPEFEVLFRADREPERLDFKVAGREAWIELLPMDAGDLETYGTLGVNVSIDPNTGKAAAIDISKFDISKRNRFLVSHTLVNWLLWTRTRLKGGRLGDWQQYGPPGDPRDIPSYIERTFHADPHFWVWLVEKCERINGLRETDQGNSPAPSGDSEPNPETTGRDT